MHHDQRDARDASIRQEQRAKATTSAVLQRQLHDRKHEEGHDQRGTIRESTGQAKASKGRAAACQISKKSHQKKTNDSDPEQKLDQRTARKHRVDASGRERWTRLERTMSVVCLGQTTSHIDSRTLSHVLPV